MASSLSKIAGEVLGNATKKSEQFCNTANHQFQPSSEGKAIENAKDRIIRQPLRKYRVHIIQDPETDQWTSLAQVKKNLKQEKAAKEDTKFCLADAGNTIVFKRDSETRQLSRMMIKTDMQRLKQQDRKLKKLQAMQLRIQKNAADMIRNQWLKSREKLANMAPEAKLQIREQSRMAQAQSRQLFETGTIEYDQKLQDGLVVNSNSKGGFDNTERLVLEKQSDAGLIRFLNSSNVKQLKASVPSAGATSAQEKCFLQKTMDTVNQQYGQFPYQVAIGLYEKSGSHNALYDEFGIKVPLGNTLDAGAGVCRHRSMTAKVLFDEMNIKASLHSGSVRCDTGNSSGHMWNRIKMPSQREYLYDAMHNKIMNLSHPTVLNTIQASYKTKAEFQQFKK